MHQRGVCSSKPGLSSGGPSDQVSRPRRLRWRPLSIPLPHLAGRGLDVVDSPLDAEPRGREQDEDSQSSTGKVLLAPEVQAHGDPKLAAVLLRSIEQVAVGRKTTLGRMRCRPRVVLAASWTIPRSRPSPSPLTAAAVAVPATRVYNATASSKVVGCLVILIGPWTQPLRLHRSALSPHPSIDACELSCCM